MKVFFILAFLNVAFQFYAPTANSNFIYIDSFEMPCPTICTDSNNGWWLSKITGRIFADFSTNIRRSVLGRSKKEHIFLHISHIFLHIPTYFLIILNLLVEPFHPSSPRTSLCSVLRLRPVLREQESPEFSQSQSKGELRIILSSGVNIGGGEIGIFLGAKAYIEEKVKRVTFPSVIRQQAVNEGGEETAVFPSPRAHGKAWNFFKSSSLYMEGRRAWKFSN